jgi:hypothetical protein
MLAFASGGARPELQYRQLGHKDLARLVHFLGGYKRKFK